MNEHWIKWEPFTYSETTYYYIEQINVNKKGLKIILVEDASETRTVQVFFKKAVVAYSSTDESFISGVLTCLNENYGKKFYGRWPFFKVANSKYIQRLSEKLGNSFNDSSRLIHFVFLAGDSMVDVIADYEPEVVLVKRDPRILMLLYKESILPIIAGYFPIAKVILYGPRAQGEISEQQHSEIPIQIALDTGVKIDQSIMHKLEETLDDEAAVTLPCNIIDLNAVSEESRQQIGQEGIDWVKAKDI